MRRFVVVATLAAGFFAGLGDAHAAVPTGNLVKNPGAEEGTGAVNSTTTFPPPQFSTVGSFTAVRYGTPNFPSALVGSSIGGGVNFFAGGPTDQTSSGEQLIDIPGAAAEIDAGEVSVELRGHLGGLASDGDNAKVTATFEDASSDTTFGTLQIGPVTTADRGNPPQTTLLPRSAKADVPVGTRRIRFIVTATHVNGPYNDGYADNVSLALDRDPVAVNDSKTVAQDAGPAPIDVLANDTDPDGGPKLVASATRPAHGTVVVAAGGAGLTYRPNGAGYCNSMAGAAADTFTYTLNGGSAATVAVRVTCTSQPAGCRQRGLLVIGTAAADTINGTARSDVILGRNGNDRLNGLAANDCLYGESGNDRLDGGTGNDRFEGGTGRDALSGSAGSDTIIGASGSDRAAGGTGNDRISGGSGNDGLSGNSGNDNISGSAGTDRISGSTGSDRITGGSGADRINGGSGADRITGGSGRDRVAARDGRRDTINCGSGRDRVTADRIDRIARNCERVSRR